MDLLLAVIGSFIACLLTSFGVGTAKQQNVTLTWVIRVASPPLNCARENGCYRNLDATVWRRLLHKSPLEGHHLAQLVQTAPCLAPLRDSRLRWGSREKLAYGDIYFYWLKKYRRQVILPAMCLVLDAYWRLWRRHTSPDIVSSFTPVQSSSTHWISSLDLSTTTLTTVVLQMSHVFEVVRYTIYIMISVCLCVKTSISAKVVNFERVRELETWLHATNTRLVQVNGQRKYGGPPEGERDCSATPRTASYTWYYFIHPRLQWCVVRLMTGEAPSPLDSKVKIYEPKIKAYVSI